MIYLDSSAVLKLVHAEAESAALRDWLAATSTEPLVSSELGRVEVLRAARRLGSDILDRAHAVLAEFDLLPVNRAVQDLACTIGEPLLRTLDALHLASALLVRDVLITFVAYDQRLVQGARAAGLPVAVPGAE